ncbi:hypothetical protein FI667_g14579, partial [Globisporangium splendens]
MDSDSTCFVLMEEPRPPEESAANVQEGGGAQDAEGMCKSHQHRHHLEQQQMHRKQRAATFAAFVAFGLASWIMTNDLCAAVGERVPIPVHGAERPRAVREAVDGHLVVAGDRHPRRRAHEFTLAADGVRLWRPAQRRYGFIKRLPMCMLECLYELTFSLSMLAMLVLTHVGGLVSATSTVVFYPYVATFPSIFTSSLSTGEGLSGSIAALLGVIQGPYDPSTMRFSVTIFYLLCAFIMVISLIGFAFLQCHPWAKYAKHMADGDDAHSLKAHMDEEAPLVHAVAVENGGRDISSSNGNGNGTTQPQTRHAIIRSVWQLLACQLILAAFSFGVIPSVMSYVYKKFAPVDDMEDATSRYQTIASIASLILDPIARVSTSWWWVYNVRALTVVLVIIAVRLSRASVDRLVVQRWVHMNISVVVDAVELFVDVQAVPERRLRSKRLPTAAPALTPPHPGLFFFVFYFHIEQYDGEYARVVYQWSGFCTQIGAFAGTLVIFPLVFFNEKLFIE